jgi:hypothetical protein
VRATVVAALPAGPGALDLGGAIALVPLPYTRVDMKGVQVTTFLVGLFGVVGYRWPVSGDFSLGGEADLGMALWSGLDQGNPFTSSNDGTSGALPLPAFRLAVAAHYRLSRLLWLWGGPAYQVALPVSAGLKEAVSAVHLFEITAGVALQF